MKNVILVLFCALTPASVFAQGLPPGRRAPRERPPAVSPGEVQRMFDAYALLQAQDQLKMSDEQYAQFLVRFKALQDVRRKALQERAQIIQDLGRLTNSAAPDDSQIKDRLKGLQELEVRSAADLKKKYDAIDEVLDLRQQAKFRLLEELMERRKLELVGRARQANRQRNRM